MGTGYWRIEFLRPAKGDDDRCVQLHGQLEEVVGPMSIEMAEAWIDRFDNQPPAEQQPPAEETVTTSSAVPPPKRKLSQGEPAKRG